jgi:hypothetical protein
MSLQLAFDTTPPATVVCPICDTRWTGTAAWYTDGRPCCYTCAPRVTNPTPAAVARAAGHRHAKRAVNAQTDAWRLEARLWLETYLERHPTLFVDDVWALGCPEPTERRAMGGLILALARAGAIRKTGQTRPRTQGRGAPGDVWASLLYRGD